MASEEARTDTPEYGCIADYGAWLAAQEPAPPKKTTAPPAPEPDPAS